MVVPGNWDVIQHMNTVEMRFESDERSVEVDGL